MKKRVIGLLFLAVGMIQLPCLDGAWASHHAYTQERARLPSIRVLVAHDIPKAMLEVQGSYNLRDPHEGTVLGRHLQGKQRQIEPLNTGLKWGEEFPAVYQLQVLPSSPESAVIVDGVEYHGNVTFYDVGGALSVVHEVPIEEFVLSQLAGQAGQLPEEALAALAIAARSQAYYLADHPRNAYWDVDAMTSGYQGDAVGEMAVDIQRAVNGTKFMVLTQPTDGGQAITVVPTKWTTENGSSSGQRVLTTPAAAAMAENGADAAKILAHVYPGASLRRLDQR
jgi:stage II sporulation protein D